MSDKKIIIIIITIIKNSLFISYFFILEPSCSMVNKAIHWINLFPVYNAIGFPTTYPLDINLSGFHRYLTFEQLDLVLCLTAVKQNKICFFNEEW